MASVKFEKGSVEWNMFMDYWAMLQKYYIPEEDDKYWKDSIEAARQFYNKYKTDYAMALNMAFLNEIDRKWKLTHDDIRGEE